MKKILVIDDHAESRHLVRLSLGSGYNVLEADSGVSGLEIMRGEKPVLVVLDVLMPGSLDGFAVLDTIDSDHRLNRACVIMATACGETRDYENSLRRGADGHIAKPFSPSKLVSVIEHLLA